jgi:hypothetical protein
MKTFTLILLLGLFHFAAVHADNAHQPVTAPPPTQILLPYTPSKGSAPPTRCLPNGNISWTETSSTKVDSSNWGKPTSYTWHYSVACIGFRNGSPDQTVCDSNSVHGMGSSGMTHCTTTHNMTTCLPPGPSGMPAYVCKCNSRAKDCKAWM